MNDLVSKTLETLLNAINEEVGKKESDGYLINDLSAAYQRIKTVNNLEEK